MERRTFSPVFIVALFAGSQLAHAAHPVPAATQAQVPTLKTNPFSKPEHISSLPGEVVGLAVCDITENLKDEERSFVPKTIGFARGLNSYYWMDWPCYPPAKPKTVSTPVGESGDRNKDFPGVCDATTGNAAPFGIKPPFSLIEIQVNGGLGSYGDALVATHVKTLDKTSDYPLNPVAVMHDALDRFTRFKHSQAKTIDERMAIAARKALGQKNPTGPRETGERKYITWLPDKQRVQITFKTMTTDGLYHYGYGYTFGISHPGPPPMIKDTHVKIRYGTQFGIEDKLILQYSKAGKLVRETSEHRDFKTELPQPPFLEDR